MEWNEDKILEYVQQGWTLSYDKTNQKYKLQKRINGKVKSYTLPKKFNEFCDRIKKYTSKHSINKIEIFESIDSGYSLKEIQEKYKLCDKCILKLFKEYVEFKIKNDQLKDILAEIFYNLKLVEDRLNNASFMIRTSFGFSEQIFKCPICLEISKLRYDKSIGKWVCSKCGEIPF